MNDEVRKGAKAILLPVIAACFFGFVGWFSYPSLLELVSSGAQARFVSTSVEGPFVHRVLTTLAFALIGVAAVLSGSLYRKISASKNSWAAVVLLLVVTAVATGTGLGFLQSDLASMDYAIQQGVGVEIVYSLDQAPVHYVLLVATAIAFTCSLIFAFIARKVGPKGA